jgi:hypothetical protein
MCAAKAKIMQKTTSIGALGKDTGFNEIVVQTARRRVEVDGQDIKGLHPRQINAIAFLGLFYQVNDRWPTADDFEQCKTWKRKKGAAGKHMSGLIEKCEKLRIGPANTCIIATLDGIQTGPYCLNAHWWRVRDEDYARARLGYSAERESNASSDLRLFDQNELFEFATALVETTPFSRVWGALESTHELTDKLHSHTLRACLQLKIAEFHNRTGRVEKAIEFARKAQQVDHPDQRDEVVHYLAKIQEARAMVRTNFRHAGDLLPSAEEKELPSKDDPTMKEMLLMQSVLRRAEILSRRAVFDISHQRADAELVLTYCLNAIYQSFRDSDYFLAQEGCWHLANSLLLLHRDIPVEDVENLLRWIRISDRICANHYYNDTISNRTLAARIYLQFEERLNDAKSELEAADAVIWQPKNATSESSARNPWAAPTSIQSLFEFFETSAQLRGLEARKSQESGHIREAKRLGDRAGEYLGLAEGLAPNPLERRELRKRSVNLEELLAELGCEKQPHGRYPNWVQSEILTEGFRNGDETD